MIARAGIAFLLLGLVPAAFAGSPLHPDVALLDIAGRNVLHSGQPIWRDSGGPGTIGLRRQHQWGAGH